ncbi:ATP-dependent RNA helicase RhlE [Sulfurovum sp. TSL6]|uniref:DEAD/DEAH box helicase n=1 Tax=Sulfurovum sp. TSL6 TaxID=2826995 RepID=UPI001CC5B439|nr:DEAD/DEAH box helicase [Sulfurovum sp. TSL6]GIT99852.1 ATP-dependent RNA helicase RhlE [Sulfurovum sp. TSL6]
MSLATLGLSSEILKALNEKGYDSATPIQKALIPAMFTGRDIMAGAQTGTGKTAGFSLPILQDLSKSFVEGQHYPKAVILVPTRELAKQVHASIEAYGKYLPLKSIVLYGGANLTSQANRLKAGVDIIVATSGRLLEHIGKNNVNLESVDYLVLDEADTILDMGFVHEVSKILQHLPDKRQNVLISATLSGSVKRLAEQILQKPKLIEVDSMGTSADTVEQIVYPVEKEKKTELLSYLIGSRNYKQVLVFTRKKEVADDVSKELNLSGLKTAVIHGGKSSGERSRALEGFKEGKVRVLVATDIAARGLDIPALSVVMNYDIPHVTGDYIHRIGRTGRAGAKGLAITLISPLEMVALKEVERLMGKRIPQEKLEGYAPKVIPKQKGARKNPNEHKNTDGAFGKKKTKTATAPKSKKRKTTKRDGFKTFDAAKPKMDKKDKKRGRGRK